MKPQDDVQGRAVAQKRKSPRTKAGKQPVLFQIKHQLERRIRVHIPSLKGDNIAKAALIYHLNDQHPSWRLRANTKTGSLTIEVDDRFPPLKFTQVRDAVQNFLQQFLNDPDGHIARRALDPRGEKAALRRQQGLQETPWWSLSAEECLIKLKSSQEGLNEQEVDRRLLKYGSNQIAQYQRPSAIELIYRQLANSQTVMLTGSAALSALTGGFFDVAMIGGVVTLNSIIGYVSENHAESVISSIGRLPPQVFKVIRQGKSCLVPDSKLTLGDIVILECGLVPADMRLIKAKRLQVDESALTGESMPVEKNADHTIPENTVLAERDSMIYRGTIITSGQGLGVVVATGELTEIGRINRLVRETDTTLSPLQKNLDTLGKQTVWASSLLCGGVFLVGLARGHRLIDMMATSISLAVAAVPEGLPTIGTSTLALGVQRLEKKGILARRLPVVETLGSVDVICLDKTGTLTLNKMQVERLQFLEHNVNAGDLDQRTHQIDIHRLLIIASLCNDSSLNQESWQGSATELAFIEAAIKAGLDPQKLQSELPRFKSRYRTETRQYMATYHRNVDGFHLPPAFAAVKGNPVQLISLCKYIAMGEDMIPLTDEQRLRLLQQNELMAGDALRVLGIAYGKLPNGGDYQSVKDMDLVWVGLAGLRDPTRDGMAQLMQSFHRAGIRTIMMTGDQTATARAIGKELGLNAGDEVTVMDASTLTVGSKTAQLSDSLDRVQVFSRVSPSEKLKIVKALQSKGHVVAMTGDGINDSPALKAADVGIAMGLLGTAAARESADLILVKDDLDSILEAIQQGRSIRSNLQRSIKFLLATNFSEILLMFGSIALGRGTPLNAIQLLWINLITDVFPAMALALEKPRGSELEHGLPKDPTHLFSPAEQKELLLHSGVLTAAAIGVYEFTAHRFPTSVSGQNNHAATMAFATLTSSQMLYGLTASESSEVKLSERLQRLASNPILGASIVASLALVLLGVRVGGVRNLLKNELLDTKEIFIAAASSGFTFWANELLKRSDTNKEFLDTVELRPEVKESDHV